MFGFADHSAKIAIVKKVADFIQNYIIDSKMCKKILLWKS